MKNIRIPILLVGFVIGTISAYSISCRVIFRYVNICDDVFHQYTRVSNYNPASCAIAFTRPCFYESPVDLGPYTYEASLIAAGALSGGFNGCYVVH
jgi:hypothetical protein